MVILPEVFQRSGFLISTSELNASIGGYCNATTAKYRVHNNYLEVLERGGTTLMDCGGDEETEVFTHITANNYLDQPAKKVYFQITENKKGFFLWIDETHKLFFSEKITSRLDGKNF